VHRRKLTAQSAFGRRDDTVGSAPPASRRIAIHSAPVISGICGSMIRPWRRRRAIACSASSPEAKVSTSIPDAASSRRIAFLSEGWSSTTAVVFKESVNAEPRSGHETSPWPPRRGIGETLSAASRLSLPPGGRIRWGRQALSRGQSYFVGSFPGPTRVTAPNVCAPHRAGCSLQGVDRRARSAPATAGHSSRKIEK
jgi:hypothetical protein